MEVGAVLAADEWFVFVYHWWNGPNYYICPIMSASHLIPHSSAVNIERFVGFKSSAKE